MKDDTSIGKQGVLELYFRRSCYQFESKSFVHSPIKNYYILVSEEQIVLTFAETVIQIPPWIFIDSNSLFAI